MEVERHNLIIDFFPDGKIEIVSLLTKYKRFQMKSILLLFVLSISISVFAQSPIAKGTIGLNGNLSFSSQSYENSDPSLSILTINPQASYFIVNNISIGLAVNYERKSIGSSSTNYGIGPSLRYYFSLEKLYPFISLGYSFTKSFNSNNDDTFNGNQYIITGGISYFLAKNVAIETSVSYKIDRYTLPDSYRSYYKDLVLKSNIIMVGVGINFYIH
jgi:outer membrane protein